MAVSPLQWLGSGLRLVLTVGKESCDYAHSNAGEFNDVSKLDFSPIPDCVGYTSVSFPKEEGSTVAFASGKNGKIAKIYFNKH